MGKVREVTRTFCAFDTICSFRLLNTSETVLDEVQDLCSYFESLLSHTIGSSDVCRISQGNGRAVRVKHQTAQLISQALHYCELTGGLFDITMAPLVALWDFKRAVVPAQSRIDAALAHVDWHIVHVNDDSIWLDDPEASIVLGGVAKGYIADCIVALLKSRNVTDGWLNLGGNVVAMGFRPDGNAWSIGIRNPKPSSVAKEESIAAIPLSNASMVTSGIYERAFSSEEGLQHHILDPRTGFPAKTDLVSASVISTSSLEADALATALIVMGSDAAQEFIANRPSVSAVLITNEGRILHQT